MEALHSRVASEDISPLPLLCVKGYMAADTGTAAGAGLQLLCRSGAWIRAPTEGGKWCGQSACGPARQGRARHVARSKKGMRDPASSFAPVTFADCTERSVRVCCCPLRVGQDGRLYTYSRYFILTHQERRAKPFTGFTCPWGQSSHPFIFV